MRGENIGGSMEPEVNAEKQVGAEYGVMCSPKKQSKFFFPLHFTA